MIDTVKIVAITGQSGSGKSTLSSFYAMKGYPVADCDQIAKQIRNLPQCQEELAQEFGEDILTSRGIDAKLLASRAFVNPSKLQALTKITHPFIIQEIIQQAQIAQEKGHTILFVDGAVIVGHSFEEYCDEIIVVVASVNKQIQRLTQRDNITPEQVLQRLEGQTSYSNMLAKANYVINNNKTAQELILQGQFVLQSIEKHKGGPV